MFDDFEAKSGLSQQFFADAQAYLVQHYVPLKPAPPPVESPREEAPYDRFVTCDQPKVKLTSQQKDSSSSKSQGRFRIREKHQQPQNIDLDNRLLALMASQKEESFIEALHAHIQRRLSTAPIIYRRAHLDRRHFSKIISQQITPSKDATIALALALKLNLEETQTFIGKAGYTLTHSEKRDILIEYCITQKTFDIDEVNALLIHFNQAPLGEK